MHIKFSPELERDLDRVKRTDRQLYKRIEKQLNLFIDNPKHPSLRIHKLTGRLGTYWSLSVSRDIRLVYLVEGETATFVGVGTHDQVYENNSIVIFSDK